jgi:hypothetical protein
VYDCLGLISFTSSDVKRPAECSERITKLQNEAERDQSSLERFLTSSYAFGRTNIATESLHSLSSPTVVNFFKVRSDGRHFQTEISLCCPCSPQPTARFSLLCIAHYSSSLSAMLIKLLVFSARPKVRHDFVSQFSSKQLRDNFPIRLSTSTWNWPCTSFNSRTTKSFLL